MKKIILCLIVIIPVLGFSQTTLVEWTFPTNTSATASGGTAENLAMELMVYGGTSAITYTVAAPDYAASATKWNAGNGIKYWQIKVVTLGYNSIKLSSKQYSSGTGPRDFKAQYSTDYSANWNDFAGNTVTVASNWTTGVLSNVPLPSSCDDMDTVYIRWIMTSDSAVTPGALAGSTGSSKIDNIIITGESGITQPAAKLSIVSVNGGVSPTINIPFDVIVNSLDANNVAANVTANTTVNLSLTTGTGTLGGAVTGVINAGTNTVTVSGVTYDVAESGVSITAADQSAGLSSATSGVFTVVSNPPPPPVNCNTLFSDDFTDGDFAGWTGDDTKFIVDTNWLRVNDAGTASASYLSAPNNINVSYDTITWDIRSKINYNTSLNNNARFYLISDSANLKSSLNGYFVQLGGTNDNISLCRQNGTTITTLVTGVNVYTGYNSNLFRVKVMFECATGLWTLSSDSTGGINFITDGSATDTNFAPSAKYPYLGVYCKYTTTTGNKYFFDDINVVQCGDTCTGKAISVVNAYATTNTTVVVVFSDPTDCISAQDINNYSGVTVNSIACTPGDSVILTLASPLVCGNFDTITISNVTDTSGNPMAAAQSFPVTFCPDIANIRITEIMYNPPEGGTDTLEFIELRNNEFNTADISGYYFANGVVYTFPANTMLGPRSYVIIAKNAAAVNSFFNITGALKWTSGTLTNSGELIELVNSKGVLIDSITYGDGTGDNWPKNANGLGSSLMLGKSACNPYDIPNWWASDANNANTYGQVEGITVYATPLDSAKNGVCVGIKELSPLSEIYIAPNPARSYVNIFNIKNPVEIKMFDILGNLVAVKTSKEDSTVTVNFGKLIKGMYFLQLKDNTTNTISSKKILIF